MVNVIEAVGFSTVIYHLGRLSVVDASHYAALLAGGLIVCVLMGITGTAGRLRDRPWLAAIDDFEKGAGYGAFLPGLAYALLWLQNGEPSHDIIWYGAIALCAAIGGAVNLGGSRGGRFFLLPLREKVARTKSVLDEG